ncbi:hypothetical protein HYH02_014613 [Chlamydomonas schloesseri]|uniref:Insulin-degrading enzyme n=1 Tax=Chlamydomonas schloesseri TaxID=2026947 RepID=A0A835VVH9_9CHLO|nr:hypothetical protein HYH02_014613 [Chlamydomonas schloesseri]|eukprot:KAG2427393.1 hypothetical protein HYH02_014613 [Chlamydomonas schloesseri]
MAPIHGASSVQLVKPANDDMEYRYLQLPNGLRVLLISDPTADKAGAAMDVCVGSLSDPASFPGLAHFTEHMLFYSSAKYPVEDEYTKFISDHGGATNAYTSAEHTNYHFDINWESLGEALDRFAQFFIEPLISQDGIEREVRAVDSEHGKNLNSDPWRKQQVNKSTANPEHPWSRFSTGTRHTLYEGPLAAGSDPRSAVVDFHCAHYSADRCCLAVLGRQPLGQLQDMVVPLFSQVPNKRLDRPQFSDAVFLPDQRGVLLRLVPVKEGQSLEMVWQVPPSERQYRQQPLGYLSHLLGHEGEGSVFALLKARGWASALWAGESGGGMSFASFFTVHIELTEEGQRHIQQVAQAVFSYIGLMRAPGGICGRIWEEVRGLAQLHFDTRDKGRAFSYTTSLAAGLHTYPPQDLLPALYGVPLAFDPPAISAALDLLTPEAVRVFWISKQHLQEEGQEEEGQQQEGKEEGQAAAGAALAVVEDETEREDPPAPVGPGAAVSGVEAARAEDAAPATSHCTAQPTAAAAASAGRGAAADAPAAPSSASAAPASGPASSTTHTVASTPLPTTPPPPAPLLTEPYYGAQYSVAPLPAAWLAGWRRALEEGQQQEGEEGGQEQGLHLPAPNPFIPTDLTLAADEDAAAPAQPAVALAVPGRLRLWHKPDTRFGQPKAVLYLDIQSPEAYSSPRAAVLTRLFVKLVLDYLNEVAYPAQQAGLDYNLLNTQSGLQLLLSGYNHKLPHLMTEVLGRLGDFKVLPDRFEFVREGLVREYANQMHNQPYSWAMYRAELLTTARRWPLELYGAIAAGVTPAELEEHVRRLTSRCFVEGLAAGNMRRAEAVRCGGLVLALLRDKLGAAPLHECERAELRVNKLPTAAPAAAATTATATTAPPPPPEAAAAAAARQAEAEAEAEAEAASSGPQPPLSAPQPPQPPEQLLSAGWLFAEEGPSGRDENSAAVVLYQRGPDDIRRNALGQLLVQLSKRDAFAELRTRQQLGYIVSLHGGAEHGVGYLELLVQSNSHDADDLCRRMDDFVGRLLDTELPQKCGLATRAGPEPACATGERSGAGAGEAAPPAPPEPVQTGPSPASPPAASPTEFAVAVEELAKAKLEKPKKLGDLANRWWSEIQHGTYVFNRQEAEVAALRSLRPAELLAFARELLGPATCRKLSVQVRGKAEAARKAQAGASAADPDAAGPDAAAADLSDSAAASGATPGAAGQGARSEAGEVGGRSEAAAEPAAPRRPYASVGSNTTEAFGWKRCCESWPSVRALWAARRAAAGGPGLPEAVGEQEQDVVKSPAA